MKLAAVLKTLLRQKRLSEAELARLTGIGQPVIHRMASGETHNPKIETLRPIARFFSISVDQLIGDEPLLPNVNKQVPMHKIPIFTLAEVLPWIQQQSHGKSLSYIYTDAEITADSFAIKLKESSFYPLFPEGTEIIFDPGKIYTNKDFVIVHLKHHKQPTLKQLLMDGEDIYLKPLNPEFQIMPITNDDKILGTMLQAKIDFSE